MSRCANAANMVSYLTSIITQNAQRGIPFRRFVLVCIEGDKKKMSRLTLEMSRPSLEM